jgi:hypothetical protein
VRSEAADAARISPQHSGLVARTTRINLRRCRQRPLGGLGYKDPTAACSCYPRRVLPLATVRSCAVAHSSVRPLVPTTQSPMSGQEHKDGQFYKTPRRQEPNSYALQEIHGVIMESTNITTRPQLTNPSWKSWTTMVHHGKVGRPWCPQLTNPLRCTAPQEARIPLGRRARFEHCRAACY